ncbi:nickel/cobalt transporter [Micromonospora sp. NPDC092111]|uniref:nickel/cobalt transporter n=1 Tax=Micromonospora sp. NPDC092111 TaxID=3364289 RepID=UPI00381DB46F
MNGLTGLDARLVAFFDGGVVFWLALLVALGVGAAHAVAPGHGKSITAAYLVGTHGRYRDAARLGVIVAVMHTFSVLVLALAWVGVSGVAGLGTESVTGWLQALAGLVVVGVGLHLTYRHLTGRSHSHSHGDGHSHSHSHSDGHSHGHSHSHGSASDGAPTDPWSRRGLVALGLSGGLLPSPSAFLVLVSGLLTGRAPYAVLLVAAFGVGMAATLTAVGVITVRGYALLAGRAPRWSPIARLVAWAPLVAGIAVSTGGCLYLVAALTTLTT